MPVNLIKNDNLFTFIGETEKRFISTSGEEEVMHLKKVDMSNLSWRDMSLYFNRCIYEFPNGAVLISEDEGSKQYLSKFFGSAFEDEDEYEARKIHYYQRKVEGGFEDMSFGEVVYAKRNEVTFGVYGSGI
jgi:hypothetical protein